MNKHFQAPVAAEGGEVWTIAPLAPEGGEGLGVRGQNLPTFRPLTPTPLPLKGARGLNQGLLLLFVAVPFLLIAAVAEPPPDSLVRRGNEAFARGDYAEALALYQRASERASDPGLTAFDQALARYQLARLDPTGDFAGLREAADLFRCCTALDDPHRPEALFGFANCLLFGPPGPQGENYRHALAAYDKSLELAPNSTVAAAARLNRARARLLADQYLPSPENEDKGDDPERAPVLGLRTIEIRDRPRSHLSPTARIKRTPGPRRGTDPRAKAPRQRPLGIHGPSRKRKKSHL